MIWLVMVDKIRFRNNEVTIDPIKLGRCFLESSGWKRYRIYRDNDPEETYGFLVVEVYKFKGGFSVDGNLRKFWFGQNTAVRDLDYASYVMCIKTIARLLGIKKSDLWNSHIPHVEIGGNVKLKRTYEFIIPSMISFPRLKRSKFEKQTTAFTGSKIKISAYDKTKEVLKTKPKKFRETICKGVFVMRFEIQIKSPRYTSGMAGKMDTLEKIKENWNDIIDYWNSTYEKIEYSQIQNPQITSKTGNLSRRELKDFAFVKAVELLSMDYFENVIDQGFLPQKRSWEKKQLRLLCEKYRSENTNQYINHVQQELCRKAKRMKRIVVEVP